jgi:hypothetical protein
MQWFCCQNWEGHGCVSRPGRLTYGGGSSWIWDRSKFHFFLGKIGPNFGLIAGREKQSIECMKGFNRPFFTTLGLQTFFFYLWVAWWVIIVNFGIWKRTSYGRKLKALDETGELKLFFSQLWVSKRFDLWVAWWVIIVNFDIWKRTSDGRKLKALYKSRKLFFTLLLGIDLLLLYMARKCLNLNDFGLLFTWYCFPAALSCCSFSSFPCYLCGYREIL